MSERINARLSQPLAEFVDRMVGHTGLYETPSEYVRDLIRRDMERRDGQIVKESSLQNSFQEQAGVLRNACPWPSCWARRPSCFWCTPR